MTGHGQCCVLFCCRADDLHPAVRHVVHLEGAAPVWVALVRPLQDFTLASHCQRVSFASRPHFILRPLFADRGRQAAIWAVSFVHNIKGSLLTLNSVGVKFCRRCACWICVIFGGFTTVLGSIGGLRSIIVRVRINAF